jgi:putative flippase GtrA
LEARSLGNSEENSSEVALKKFIGFALAGGSATVINFCVFLLLISQDVDVVFASAIGYVSGIAISFTLNRSLVFKSSNNVSLVRYFVLYAIALICQLLLLALLLGFRFEPWIANAISVTLVLIANYFAMRKFVFYR